MNPTKEGSCFSSMNCINVVNNLLDLEHFSGDISPIQHMFLKSFKDIFCFSMC